MIEIDVFNKCMNSLYSYLGANPNDYFFGGLYQQVKKLSYDEFNETLKILAKKRGIVTRGGETGIKYVPASQDFTAAIDYVLSKNRKPGDIKNLKFDFDIGM